MPKVTMPQLGESVAEGTIGKWLKQVGDHVEKYEPLVEVITDKVNAEVPSPFEGTLTEILAEEGQTVPNNAEIAVVEVVGDAAGATNGHAAPVEAGPVVAAAEAAVDGASDGSAGTAPEGRSQGARPSAGGFGPAGSDERPERRAPAAEAAPAAQAPPAAAATSPPPSAYEGRMTPAVRRLAREHGVDLSLISGSGHAGRVTRDDVLRFVEQGGANGAVPAGSATPAAATLPAAPPPAAPGGVGDALKPQTPMRRAIAAHMSKAKQTVPHAYTTVEVDMSAVVALRESIKATYQAREGLSLSYVPIVTKAVVEALRRHPELNGHWTDEGLMRRQEINVGIAIAVDDGLVVPVIRRADQLSINGLNHAVQDFATRARANRLRLEDVQGGTFTVNNTGWFGSIASQPIVNTPEVAILSMEAIVKRPVVIESPSGDSIAIRSMMNLCVSFDHRATDGAQIGRFVQDVRRWLESADAQTSIW